MYLVNKYYKIEEIESKFDVIFIRILKNHFNSILYNLNKGKDYDIYESNINIFILDDDEPCPFINNDFQILNVTSFLVTDGEVIRIEFFKCEKLFSVYIHSTNKFFKGVKLQFADFSQDNKLAILEILAQ